jgi:hypothetical protein
LGNPDGNIRSSVAIVLGDMGVSRPSGGPFRFHKQKQIWAVEPLINALSDTNADVRSNAATALGKLGDVRAVEPLINALSDTNADVRSNAATALGKLGDVRAVEPLIPLLKDTDGRYIPRVCDVVAKSLKKIGTPEALEAVRLWRATNIPAGRYTRFDDYDYDDDEDEDDESLSLTSSPFGSSSQPLPETQIPRPRLNPFRTFGNSTPPPDHEDNID